MSSIRIEARDDVVVAQLSHGKANALDLELCREIVRVLDELAGSTARAVVLTGTGAIFSAGVDLIRLVQDGAEYRDEFVPAISELVIALLRFPKPLVAAVNGHAVAGGCVIACTADHRIMARNSGQIGVPELLVGLPFPAAALEAVRLVVPRQHLRDVVYGGGTYVADDARAVGLIDEAVDPDTLLDRAVAVAARLGAVPTDVFALTKRALFGPALANIQAAIAYDAEVASVWKHPATLGRVQDYVERTFKRRDH